MLVRLGLVVAVCVVVMVDCSQDIMKQLSINFAKPLALCRKEMDLPEGVVQDFQNFWREGYELTTSQTGCAIMCISSKLELLDAELNLHHGKATEFAKKHGADDATAKQIIDLIHNCGKTVESNPDDPCMTTLNIAKCFKAEIHKLNWAPDVDLMIGEFLAEV